MLSRLSRLWHWFFSHATFALLMWLALSGGGAAVITALIASITHLHGGLRYLFIVGLLVFVAASLYVTLRFVVKLLPSGISDVLEPKPRPDPRAVERQAQSERDRNYRRATRFITKEIADGRRRLTDSLALGWYASMPIPIDLWEKNHAVLADAPGAREAYQLAGAAYHGFERINGFWLDDASKHPLVMPIHHVDNAIAAAHAAEQALDAFERTLVA